MAVGASVRTARGHARTKQREGELSIQTLETEILKEAVDFAKAKKWIVRSPVLPGGEQ